MEQTCFESDPYAPKSSVPIYKVALTGGPCAGKTTALSRLCSYFGERGFRVFTVPEAATLLFSNGISIQDFEIDGAAFAFQWSLLKLQIQLEDSIERVAKTTGKPSIILCDRGLMDGAAYISSQLWTELLDYVGLQTSECREERYSAVFHLVTAAVGAEEHYQVENNTARTESLQQAVELDKRLQAAWLGHHHLYIFGNRPGENFEKKISRVLDRASRLVGLPFTQQKPKKYKLLKEPKLHEFPVLYEEFIIEKYHITYSDPEISHRHSDQEATPVRQQSTVERRQQAGRESYFLTTITELKDDVQIETIRRIGIREFSTLVNLEDACSNHHALRRVVFLWQNNTYALQLGIDSMENGEDTGVLYIEGDLLPSKLELPHFLSVEDM